MNNEEEIKQVIEWKSASVIPTEHWEHNNAISPLYLVHCGYNKGFAVIGYARYSYAGKCWMKCYDSTDRSKEYGWTVEKWSETKL